MTSEEERISDLYINQSINLLSEDDKQEILSLYKRKCPSLYEDIKKDLYPPTPKNIYLLYVLPSGILGAFIGYFLILIGLDESVDDFIFWFLMILTLAFCLR